MTRKRGSFAGDTLHRAAIAEDGVCVVGEEVETWLVELGSSVHLSNGETDGVGEALTKRTSRHFNARSVVSFGMARSNAVDLAEMLEIVYADLVSEQVEESILQHAGVTIAKYTVS